MNETNVTNDIITSCLQNELDKPEYKGRLRAVDEDDLKKILNRLVNHIVHDEEETNANALISADDPETAVTYGTILANALEKIISFDVCVPVNEAQLYEWNATLKNKNPKAKVLLVNGLNAPDPGILFKTLTDFEKQKYTPAVILCTTNDVVEKLKEYDVQDQKLYHYLCGLRKITIPGIAQADIADTICDRLAGEGNEVTKSFREKLKVHVEAIYADAVLQKEAFLEDLIVRIKSVHSEKSVDLWNLYDGEDVPPSDKADALLKKTHNMETTSEEKKDSDDDKENVTGESVEKEEAADSETVDQEGCEAESEKSEETELVAESYIEKAKLTGEKKHPVMLMAMSTFPKGPLEENVFIRPRVDKELADCTPEELITGCKSQLEPVAKIMLETIGKGSVVDFVIMGTPETSEKNEVTDGKEKKNISAEDYFIERIIDDYLNKNSECHFTKGKEDTSDFSRTVVYSDNENNIDVRFNIVTIDQGNILKGIGDTVNTIRDIDKNKYEADKDNISIELWVDTHGGFRDITFIMASLLSILKSEGIEPRYKYGVQYNIKQPEQNKIIEQPKMFEMFDFVTGMNDFFNYGNASVLKELREKREERKKDRNKEDKKDLPGEQLRDSKEKEFLEILDMIAQGTQFCDPYLYRTGVEDLIKYKNENHESNNKKINSELDIFKDSIYSDFGDILEQKPDSVDLDLAIIERCVNKGLYQQALTFIEALMPRFFFEKKILFYEQTEDNKRIISDNKKANAKDYVDNINYVFDANLSGGYLKPGLPKKDQIATWGEKIQQNEQKTNIETKKMIEYFSYKYRSENEKTGNFEVEKLYDKLEQNVCKRMFSQKEKNGIQKVLLGFKDQKEIEINSRVEKDSEKERIADIFLMHKVLKNCRNVFNHGKESVGREDGFECRAKTGDIEKTIRRYIAEVRKINLNGVDK